MYMLEAAPETTATVSTNTSATSEAKNNVLTACVVLREHGGKGGIKTPNSTTDTLDVESDAPEAVATMPGPWSLHSVAEDEGFSELADSDGRGEEEGKSLESSHLDNDHLAPEAIPTAHHAPSSESTDLQQLLRSLHMIRDHGSFIVACKDK
ncbi:hypothetical protein LTS18_011116, partial [Coniosporium uncinatum]